MLRKILAFSALLFMGSPLLAQDLPTHFDPMDFFRIQLATDPEISPEGKRIVYVRNSADISTDRRAASSPATPGITPKTT